MLGWSGFISLLICARAALELAGHLGPREVKPRDHLGVGMDRVTKILASGDVFSGFDVDRVYYAQDRTHRGMTNWSPSATVSK